MGSCFLTVLQGHSIKNFISLFYSVLILLLLVAHTKGNQLDKLINFAKGSGPNPSGGTRSSSQHSAPSPQQSIPGGAQNTHASPRRPTATVAYPIPFAELADPTRGQVQLV